MTERIGTDCGILAQDIGTESAARDRILLPYRGKAWDDLMLDAQNEVFSALPDGSAEDLPYEKMVDALRIYISFNIQRRVRTTVYCTVLSPLVSAVHFRCLYQLGDRAIADALARFFSGGAAGLAEEYRAYYERVYKDWRDGK